MEERLNVITQRTNSTESAASDPLAKAEQLAASIERAVRRKTSGGVRNLRVEINRSGVILQGRCETFYCKQLAQHAAMNISDNPLKNEIKVS